MSPKRKASDAAADGESGRKAKQKRTPTVPAAGAGAGGQAPATASESAATADPMTTGTPADALKKPRKTRKKRKQDERTKEERDTERGLQRHIRALCGLLTGVSTLARADRFIDHFERRHQPVDNLQEHIEKLVNQCRNPNAEAHRRAMRLQDRVKDSIQQASGNIASDLSSVPHEHLAASFAAVTAAGLLEFHPDVFGYALSPYNQIHRQIAVSTFQAVATWFGFTELRVSLAITRDTHRLNQMYDKFVRGTLTCNSRRVESNPQSLVDSAELQNAKKRREQLCLRHYGQAKIDGVRRPILRLIKQEACHSDDESIPPKVVNNITYKFQARQKLYRNPTLTAYMRFLDTQIDAKWQHNPVGRRPEPRVTWELKDPSPLSRIHPPPSYYDDHGKELIVSIDVFKPEYYNNTMDIQEKALFAENGVAFPEAKHTNTVKDVAGWKKLGVTEFMEKYGNAVLNLYEHPTAEELEEERLRWEAEDGDDELGTDLEDSDNEPAVQPDMEDDDV
ncbi:hypothetical protein C8F01DRAFT_1302655 [Mycena amicta]|nr:hypothetical protein C8F01DRAFT_1302655 [Mycena amicta]